MLLLQGLDDPVVPPQQSRASPPTWPRTASGTRTSPFAGESHGFRKAATIIAALEAELSFYGQILGFTPPGIPPVQLTTGKAAEKA